MISLKELAKECNVSVATASKALHDYPDIGSKTRDYIKQKARELGYYPNSHASALKNNRSQTISLLYGDILGSGETVYNLTGDYFSRVFESFREEADLQSYGIILSGFYVWERRRKAYEDTDLRNGYRRNLITSPGRGNERKLSGTYGRISESEQYVGENENQEETISLDLTYSAGKQKMGLSQAQLLRNADRTPVKTKSFSRRMSALEYCRYRDVDGVLLAGVDFASEEIQQLLDSDIPVVTLDYISPRHSGVSCDLWTGMENLLQYIYSLGHRNYMYLSTRKEEGGLDKLEAFMYTMKSLGIPKDDYTCISLEMPGSSGTINELYTEIEKIVQETVQRNCYLDSTKGTQKDPLPCLVCSDDLLAYYAIQAMDRKGLRVGEDMSVAGYGGNMGIRTILPGLTTLEQDTTHIGRLLAGRLIEEIEYPSSAIKEHTIVKGKLRKGKTVGAIEKRGM